MKFHVKNIVYNHIPAMCPQGTGTWISFTKCELEDILLINILNVVIKHWNNIFKKSVNSEKNLRLFCGLWTHESSIKWYRKYFITNKEIIFLRNDFSLLAHFLNEYSWTGIGRVSHIFGIFKSKFKNFGILFLQTTFFCIY